MPNPENYQPSKSGQLFKRPNPDNSLCCPQRRHSHFHHLTFTILLSPCSHAPMQPRNNAVKPIIRSAEAHGRRHPQKGGMATETRGAPSIIRSASLVCTRPTVTATLKGRNGKRRRAARTACSQTQPLRCQANSHHRRCRREASRRRVTNTRTACLRARCARASCRRV